MKKADKIQTAVPKELIANLEFKEFDTKNKLKGFHMDWLSGKIGEDKFSLQTTAGMGGSCVFINFKGKTYAADMKDILTQIIDKLI